MKLVTVIVTFNNQATIADCLRSLTTQNPGEIYIIDSASTDQTIWQISQVSKKINLVKSSTNLGFARGNNLAIEKIISKDIDLILILNPDAVLLPGCIKYLINAAKKYNYQSIIGPKIYADYKKKRIWSAGGELDKLRYTAKLIGFGETQNENFQRERECEYISGTCMLIPRKLFNLGLKFYEPYFMYYEDVEFSLKSKLLGFTSIYIPQAEIIHQEKVNHDKQKLLKDYYLARNHLLFVERNAPFKIKLREWIRMPKTILDHLLNQDYLALKGIRDYFLRRFHKYETN